MTGQEARGAAHPLVQHELRRRDPLARDEHAGEVRAAEPGPFGQLVDGKLAVEVFPG